MAGGVVAILALGFLSKAAADLGQEETEDRVGELRTDGLYRYTRNPQNLGYVLLFWGVAVASASPLVAILAGVLTVWLVTQSFIGIRSLRRGARAVRSSGVDADS